jgi:tRNA pseudouridine38-40 synthase
MVRNMVGVLIEAGRKNLGPQDIITRLDKGAAFRPGLTVPASGLFLISVEYDSPVSE